MSVDSFRKREKKYVEYMCRYCGTKTSKGKDRGRPLPGKCSRRSGNMPHSWVKNREWQILKGVNVYGTEFQRIK